MGWMEVGRRGVALVWAVLLPVTCAAGAATPSTRDILAAEERELETQWVEWHKLSSPCRTT
jgi:hypothetical protein